LATVLGADDGTVSTASLVIGVAAAAASRNTVLAAAVAERLMAVDPLGSHVRDELGLQPGRLARPLQAAVVSAVSFALGAAGYGVATRTALVLVATVAHGAVR
jgi:VIT1/CCC1 family predicted Fe2+/Mn2+ transporter